MDTHTRTNVSLLLAAVAVHASLLLGLSSLQRGSRHPALRRLFWALSAAYFPLMSYVLSQLTGYINGNKSSHDDDDAGLLITVVVLVQFLKAKADMAALTVGAVASPVAGDDDSNGLKIRPSLDNLVNSLWVAGLVIYNIIRSQVMLDDHSNVYDMNLEIIVLAVPLWALGGCRMVLKFAAFRKATRSFAHGRNVLLIQGHMAHLQQQMSAAAPPPAPRLIVTGERKRDVVPSPQGYRVEDSVLRDRENKSTLVTLDQVGSLCDDSVLFRRDQGVCQKSKDLCLSMALFKCLRRRFAGLPLAEAGSDWARRFVLDGLPLDSPQEAAAAAGGGSNGDNDNDERVFRVIADELSFAMEFYYSPLPVASLGAAAAALHFLLSLLIVALFCSVLLTLLAGALISKSFVSPWLPLVVAALAVINASVEIWQMVDGVRSNWTKVSIIGHYLRCRCACARKIFVCLLGCKPKRLWKDEIRQVDLPTMAPNLSCWGYIRSYKHLFRKGDKTHRKVVPKLPISGDTKAAILSALRRSGGHLSSGTTAVRGWCQRRPALSHDRLSWAYLGGGEVTTAIDAILVWHIATSLFDIRSGRGASSSSSSRPAAGDVACHLSRYCAYLVAEAPELLPDDPGWTTEERFEKVTESITKAKESTETLQGEALYGELIHRFSGEGCHVVVKQGSALAKQLVEEAEAGGQDAVWELLKEFWSEMLLFLAPSDNNVKCHIQALQRGGELITLLWALLVHAGITSRPDPNAAEP